MRGPAPSPPPSPPFDFLSLEDRVWIMGVINATPDSFYADSRSRDLEGAAAKAREMAEQGADVIDIGGESTRPGASPVSLAEELNRALPLIDRLRERWPAMPLSIDTQKAEVARRAWERGIRLINDVSALRHDPAMADVVAESRCAVVLMHMQGTPPTMQENPCYRDVIDALKAFFEERLAYAVQRNIPERNIVLDPGIGFGKTRDHNIAILKRLSELAVLGRPLLIGVSRKSFIGGPPEMRLEGSLAANLWAVSRGALGLRVHDVEATRRALSMWQELSAPPRE